MKKNVATILILFSLSCFIIGGIFCYKGFHKKNNYYQSDYSWGKDVNAYVGGDAYNYIINGTYFAGYCALSGAFFICGTVSGIYGMKFQIECKDNGITIDTKTDNSEILDI